jgi:membrane protease YdiL (CAAX protease family)
MLVGLWWGHRAWFALALYHSGMIMALVAWRRDLRELTRGWRPATGLALVLAGAATGPLLIVLYPLARTSSAPVGEILRSMDLAGAAWIPFALYYSFIHPGIEEAYWRGLVPEHTHPAWSDLAYGGYHALVLARFAAWPAAVATALGLAATGMVWRRVARATGGLAVPWACHLAADAAFIGAVAWLWGTGG